MEGNILETCGRHTGDMLEECWRIAGYMLEECWIYAGDMLETCCRHAGDILENADVLGSNHWNSRLKRVSKSIILLRRYVHGKWK